MLEKKGMDRTVRKRAAINGRCAVEKRSISTNPETNLLAFIAKNKHRYSRIRAHLRSPQLESFTNGRISSPTQIHDFTFESAFRLSEFRGRYAQPVK